MSAAPPVIGSPDNSTDVHIRTPDQRVLDGTSTVTAVDVAVARKHGVYEGREFLAGQRADEVVFGESALGEHAGEASAPAATGPNRKATTGPLTPAGARWMCANTTLSMLAAISF